MWNCRLFLVFWIAQILPISGSAQSELPKVGTQFTYAYEWSYYWWNHAESRRDTVTHELTSFSMSGDTILLHFRVIKGREAATELIYRSYLNAEGHTILASDYPLPVKIFDGNHAYSYDLTSAEDTLLLIQGNMTFGRLSKSGSSTAIFVPAIEWLEFREGMNMVMEDLSGVPATERWSYRLLDVTSASGVAAKRPSTTFAFNGNKCLINSAPGEVILITISDMLGSQVFVRKLIASSAKEEVEIPSLPQGCYIASVTVGSETEAIKFIK